MVNFLIKCGADVNGKDSGGTTALHLAASSNARDIVLLLLDHGAEVNTPDIDGDTPLHNAAAKGHRNLVELLISRGANVNATDIHGFTPLNEAMRHNYVGTAGVLHEHTVRNSRETVPVRLTSLIGHYRLVLVRKGHYTHGCHQPGKEGTRS